MTITIDQVSDEDIRSSSRQLRVGRAVSGFGLIEVGFGEPGGVEKLLMGPHVVAYQPELLPLPHPSQHHLHMPFAGQSSQPNLLHILYNVNLINQIILSYCPQMRNQNMRIHLTNEIIKGCGL